MMPLEDYWKHDLPDRLPPMVVKSLRQLMRRTQFVIPFLGVQLFALWAVLMEFSHPQANLGWAVWVVFYGAGLLMPLMAYFQSEQELAEGNDDLLWMAGVTPLSFLRGKIWVVWGSVWISQISLVPYLVVRYAQGGVEWWRELECGVQGFLLAFVMSSIVVSISTFRGHGMKLLMLVLALISFFMSYGIMQLMIMMANGGAAAVWQSAQAVAITYCYWGAMKHVGVSQLERGPQRVSVVVEVLILVVLPIVVGIGTLVTCGFGGGIVVLGCGVLLNRDATRWQRHKEPVEDLKRLRGLLRWGAAEEGDKH